MIVLTDISALLPAGTWIESVLVFG
jgi:hypothetical protein